MSIENDLRQIVSLLERIAHALEAGRPAPRRLGDEPEHLWTVQQTAKHLGVSRSWLYQQVEAGLFPCIRLGGLVRFDPGAVRAFTQNKTKGGR